MKLFYYKDDMSNFGDDLNDWLWPRVLPELLNADNEHLMLGIGTILNQKLPKAKKYTVLGSGCGYGDLPVIDDTWEIICVRGKETCKALNLSEDLAIIDPAYLLRDFFSVPVKKKYPVSLIPHAQSMEVGAWEEICDKLGIN